MDWTYKVGSSLPDWVTDPINFTEQCNGKNHEINALVGIHHVIGRLSDGIYRGVYATMPLETHISKLAHEFKTPLNTIIGYSQLLLDRDATAEVNEKIGIVLKAARHLNTLISDVVDFSKLEAKSFTFNLGPHKSKDMINDCMNYMLTAVADKKIAIIDKLSLESPVLYVDDRRFKQIIINILSNAIKYGVQHGKIEIIEICNIRERSYEIQIIDDGIGISEQDRFKLFNQFTRFSGLRVEGVGLGLVITKGLVEGMKGKINISSPGLGQGTCVTLSFPLYSTTETGGSNRILIVDDNDSNIIILREFITRLFPHLKVDICTNSKDFATLFKVDLYKIVFMDLHMPVKNGIVLAREIREMDTNKTTKIVCVSADVGARNKPGAKEVFDGFINKPYEMHEISSTVVKYV